MQRQRQAWFAQQSAAARAGRAQDRKGSAAVGTPQRRPPENRNMSARLLVFPSSQGGSSGLQTGMETEHKGLRQGVCKHFLSLSLFPLVIKVNYPHYLFFP